jgi:hypothetical protein
MLRGSLRLGFLFTRAFECDLERELELLRDC